MYFNKALQQDPLMVQTDMVKLSELTGMPTTQGLEYAIISEGTICNTVSEKYGHLKNQNYFPVIEEALKSKGIKYLVRSINRNNVQFKVDYILNDDSIHIDIKKDGLDKIKPMLSFTNAYDGSVRIAGEFGYFREVCSNGLHVSNTEIAFKIRRRGDVETIAIENIDKIIEKFISNENYELRKKFYVMAEKPITDLSQFVKFVGNVTGLFNYAASEKNPDTPSKNAKLVLETIDREAQLLHTKPTFWLGYNAFNEFIHGKDKINFDKQSSQDKKLFNIVEMMALAN